MVLESIKKQTVILSLIKLMKEKGSWCGETHIQKCVYFLQEMLKVPTNYQYILYKHGPFSFELRDELGEMRANMILDVNNRFPFGPSYCPGVASEKLEEIYPKTSVCFSDEINFVAEKLSCHNVAELERLATALYVTLQMSSEALVMDRAKEINQLKPHVTLEEAREALFTIDCLLEESKKLI